MKNGFVKVCACTPNLKVADVEFNKNEIIKQIAIAAKEGAEIIVFPELSLTGATCKDLFFSEVLLEGALNALKDIAESSAGIDALIFVGLPIKVSDYIFNVAAAINGGKVIGFTPKTNLLPHGELADKRYFSNNIVTDTIDFNGEKIAFGTNLIYQDAKRKDLTVSAEIGADLFLPNSPTVESALNGAKIIVNLSAFAQTVGKEEFVKSVLCANSSTLSCGYVLANAGAGESTTDMVFGAANHVVENGKTLISGQPLKVGITYSELDLGFLAYERSKTYSGCNRALSGYRTINFAVLGEKGALSREYEKAPFVPSEEKVLGKRAEEILDIQSEGLKKRIEHAHAGAAVLGLSGGLDSTLAILVAVNAMKKLGRPTKEVVAVTMPCFGTTSRTFQNTIKLAKALNVTLKKIDITKSVTRHLKDIKHEDGKFDVTFENAQARERTQVLMDLANMNNGLVVGTGDLSEVALGWATYNGDHMSMYGVNCTVPKTLVRHVVEAYAAKCKGKLKAVLQDILDTPVSPELLPVENDAITQKTEDIVGPYVLHDFFLYNMIRRGFSPSKLYQVACYTFKGDFSEQTILKWLKIFVRRFFIQQFKRSCVPDGVKVGTVGLSPRGDWFMPSDAVSDLWLKEIEDVQV